jgi:hypothetical protein
MLDRFVAHCRSTPVEFETEAQILDHDYNHTGERWQSI